MGFIFGSKHARWRDVLVIAIGGLGEAELRISTASGAEVELRWDWETTHFNKLSFRQELDEDEFRDKYFEKLRPVPEHFIWLVAQRLAEAIAFFTFGAEPGTDDEKVPWDDDDDFNDWGDRPECVRMATGNSYLGAADTRYSNQLIAILENFEWPNCETRRDVMDTQPANLMAFVYDFNSAVPEDFASEDESSGGDDEERGSDEESEEDETHEEGEADRKDGGESGVNKQNGDGEDKNEDEDMSDGHPSSPEDLHVCPKT
ncbi:hypothetical protein DL771_010147 [Monosporascus sp. 5C6A]|nr:hypothetical protein DL771_010147 [Monosporascus sp. 5C6A]